MDYEKLSPFELKEKVIAAADEKVRRDANTLLNAGRGNPNWVALAPRQAFFALGQFAMEECQRNLYMASGIAGVPQKEGIAQRFEAWMRANAGIPGVDFLRKAYQYCLMELALDPDSLVEEWAGGIAGHDYPSPPRILHYTEQIIRKYLDWALCNSNPPAGTTFDLFAVEGSTAGMCYCFDVLQQNFLLNPGDSIALMVPVFTPYIEIPQLSEFDYDVLNIAADGLTPDGLHTWRYNPEDILKLKDPKYKMLFVVNPSNPPSYAMDPASVEAIKEVVKANPDLMILTDDVYGTFVPGFRSLVADLPYNTMACYSYSKYFGATGWRVAVTAVAQDNVYDRLISQLPAEKKALLDRRYETLTTDVASLKFIDRMVAESRLIALNHTAGLSTPQQIQMSLFSLLSLVEDGTTYHDAMLSLIRERYDALWKSFGFEMPADPLRADYYSEIDLLVWGRKLYGDDFVNYLQTSCSPISALFDLASQYGCVLLPGSGFDGPRWSVRVSLANLDKEAYTRIGSYLRSLLATYADAWRSSKNK